MLKSILAYLAVAVAWGGLAHAQAEILPDEKTLAGADEKDVAELNPSLALTGTISLVNNANVVGQVDGLSALVGLGVTGGLDYVKDRHILRMTLSINESVARTPVIDEFVKTNDVVALEGLYNYFLTSTLGAFGRLKLETSAFAADDVRGVLTSWVEKPREAGDPFSPFTISESAGGFAEPIHGDKLALTLRFGLGGRHTFASSVLLIDDDDATPEVELMRLSNVHQLGVEGFAGATGTLKEGKLTYKAGFSVLVPFVNNDDFDRSAGELARIALESSLTVNVFDWMSLVYSLNVTRDPQLFPDGEELTQVQNNLLLTFSFALVKKKEKEKEKEKSDEEKALEAANQRAVAAESARDLAQAKVVELEQRLTDADADCAAKCAATPAATDTGPLTRPASVTDAQIALAEAALVALRELGTALTAAGSDCKAAAKAVANGSKKVTTTFTDAKRLEADLAKDAAAKAWFEQEYSPKMTSAVGPLRAANQTCGQDPDFTAAVWTLPLKP
jgi:hypothetical protein